MLGSDRQRPRGARRARSSYDEADRLRWRSRATRAAERGFDDALGFVQKVVLFVFGLVVAYLVRYQVIEAPGLSAKAAQEHTIDVTLTARRGTIYDRNGNVLAISEACQTLQCNPHTVTEPELTAEVLAEYLDGSQEHYLSLLTADGTFSFVERKVDQAVADELQAALKEAELTGIDFVDDYKRSYPYGSLAGQVLGTIGFEGEGRTGLELYYDDILRGTDGSMRKEIGADGTPIAGGYVEVSEAINGSDIVISLDVDVQQVAEREIVAAVKEYEAESGSVVVSDPRTGELLAACSTPLLDPSDLTTYTDEKASLKPIVASYEPGSIFKILTSAIGIENGLVSPASTFTVPATIQVGDDEVHDDDDRDYTMDMSLTEMLRRSSNVGLALVAQRVIGATAFAAGVETFGIGTATGIDMRGEAVGIVRSIDEYDGSSLGSMAFGQGLAVPMIQMVKAVGAIANGGVMMTPHFLRSKDGEDVAWPDAGRAISEETAAQVSDMMRVVVREGTAVAAQVSGYDVAGKTGTGEQADEGGGYKKDSFVSSLIGFAPASEPEVLVYVGLNGTPYLASGSAAPTFSTIMGEALIDMGVQPTS